MDAIELIKILEKAIDDTGMEKGPMSKVPLVTFNLTRGGLHFSSWYNESYYMKFLSWMDVLTSNGEVIMATVRRMQEDIKRRETDVESGVNSNSDVG